MLAPGSVRNWATTEDDEYVRLVKKELHMHLNEQRGRILKGLSPYGVGGLNRTDIEDWSQRNPDLAISATDLHSREY